MLLGRSLLIVLLLAGIAVGSFATLGDGSGKKSSRKLLTGKVSARPGSFSLRSGYNYRGTQVINLQENHYINLNSVVTYQQGHTTYTVPVKKKVLLNNKLTFNPNAATR
jgi:ABC-type uncharacterized transport system ATPase subunit